MTHRVQVLVLVGLLLPVVSQAQEGSAPSREGRVGGAVSAFGARSSCAGGRGLAPTAAPEATLSPKPTSS